MGLQRAVSWFGILFGVAVVVGALSAVLWAWLVRLPSYTVSADYSATMTERGQTELFAADAWFVTIGLVAGLAVGWLAWARFKQLGWPVALLAAAAGLAAGGVCVGIGQLLGPGAFDVRLATAKPGDKVPISLTLHAPSALAAWALAGVAPTLFAASLGPELRGSSRSDQTDEPAEAEESEPGLAGVD